MYRWDVTLGVDRARTIMATTASPASTRTSPTARQTTQSSSGKTYFITKIFGQNTCVVGLAMTNWTSPRWWEVKHWTQVWAARQTAGNPPGCRTKSWRHPGLTSHLGSPGPGPRSTSNIVRLRSSGCGALTVTRGSRWVRARIPSIFLVIQFSNVVS